MKQSTIGKWKLMIHADRIRQQKSNKWCVVILERRLHECNVHVYADRVAYTCLYNVHVFKQADTSCIGKIQ